MAITSPRFVGVPRPGDMAIWLNGRVMHGRESYRAGGRRHIQGAYLDQDSHMLFHVIGVHEIKCVRKCLACG